MNNKLVSIVLPVYNVEKYIAECLHSILNQDYDQMEVIIVDDCGTDNSISIVNRIVSDYQGKKEIQIISCDTNRGLSAARNRGISAARGEWIFFVDSDDYLCENNVITKMINRQLETGADVVTANSIMFDDVSGCVYTTVDKDYIDCFYRNNSEIPEIIVGGVAWNKLISSSFLKEHNLYFDEGIVYEDVVWVFKLTCSSPRLATMSDRTYRYRFRAGSIMNTLTKKHLKSKLLLPVVCFQWLSKHSTRHRAYAAIAIEDLKIGGYLAMIQTNNSHLLTDVADIYNRNIEYLRPGRLAFKDCLKLLLSKMPNFLYLRIITTKFKLNRKHNSISSNVHLNDIFVEEIKKEYGLR